MSHQYESTRGTAKEPTIEYSDSTRTTAEGSDAYGDSKVYGSNPNPHDNVADFGRDTHVNQDSLVKDRADGKDRLGNDPNSHSTLTGSSKEGDLSGTTISVNSNSGSHHTGTGTGTAQQFAHGHSSHVHDDNNCEVRPHGHPSHKHDDNDCDVRPHGHPSHKHDNTCATDNTNVSDPNATGLAAHGGSAAGAKTGKVPGAGTFDTEKKTHKEIFDGPEGSHPSHATGAGVGEFNRNTTSSGAFGSADVGGSGMGTGIRSDYDKLGNRVGPGHQEGHTFLDENHGEKVGIIDKLKSKIGMNSGDERHGDFTKDGHNLDQHGSTHAGGQGGAGRI